MKLEKQTRNHRLPIILILSITLFTLGCGEFCGGIIFQIGDLWPVYPPKPDRADAQLLDNGLTIAEAANTGRHRYIIKDANVRNGLMGVNMARSPVITHTFAGEEVTLTLGSAGKVYSRIAPNTYRSETTMRKCSPVEITLIYNRDGFATFYECPTNRKLQALISYTLVEEEKD